MRKLKAWAGRLMVVALVVGGGVAVQAPAAHAGPLCDIFNICGEVHNDSSVGVGGSGWCWSDNKPRYGSNPFYQVCSVTDFWLTSGANSTTYVDDADSFRSEVGCVTKYEVYGGGGEGLVDHGGGSLRVDDRRGLSRSKWIKLADDNEVHVVYKHCGPAMTKRYANTWAAAQGFQDQWCGSDGTSGGGQRCAADGTLYAAYNYFYCKIRGGTVSGSNGTYNTWWLLTDLDSWDANTRDGRAFVSAYYLSGGYNDTQNDRAVYWNGSAWVDFPNC